MTASSGDAEPGTSKASQKQSPDSKSSGSKSSDKTYRALWDLEGDELKSWVYSISSIFKEPTKVPLQIAQQAWANLAVALNSLQMKVAELDPEDDARPPPSKRIKTESSTSGNKTKRKRYKLEDPFNLMLHTIRNPDGEDDFTIEELIEEVAKELKTSSGGKLSQLAISGLVNGMAGVKGGLITDRTWTSSVPDKQEIPTVLNATLSQLKQTASALHLAAKTRLETDVLITTPLRIQEMLAPDLLPHEFKSIRKRIHDTVILGKGLAKGGADDEDVPTAPSTGVHELEKFKKCKSCGNNDQSLFVLDRKNGDVICSSCGTVASEALMHEGSAYRKFEGEADRNHHGDSANPLYSNAHNMSTALGGVTITTGAGLGGYGSQKRGLETVLRNAHAYTELNISQFGKGDRRTRIGYKDKQKKDSFMQMAHVGDALSLHEAVVQRSKELFAGFRDDRELVQKFKGVIAACLCEAFDQLSSDGRQILKQKQEVAPAETFVNRRATRRSELHHANLAGKGGLLLDFAGVKKDKHGAATQSASVVAQKIASKWELDDCRSWLLEASRSITQRWMEDRNNGVKGVPTGSQEEIEGKLVEHAITLCDLLEVELHAQNNKTSKTAHGRGRVVTPRVNDMAKLGIKWQHAHERGSGGKGGVGNSGKKVGGGIAAAPKTNGRTAGQILILKTSKKLGVMLKDTAAGAAIHKELRSLVGKQEAKKRALMREEATRQRMAQMKRKGWLQVRSERED